MPSLAHYPEKSYAQQRWHEHGGKHVRSVKFAARAFECQARSQTVAHLPPSEHCSVLGAKPSSYAGPQHADTQRERVELRRWQ